jgi:Tol biopolymer transport system component
MNKTRGFVRVVLELALLGGLLIGLAAVIGGLRARPGVEQPGAPTPYLPPELRLPTPTEAGLPYPPPRPTYPPVTPEPTATREPTPTLPPVPTPLPTPVVTPFPVAQPPYIPEVVGKTHQPFWIIYWQGNEVWRVDDSGQERELLLDTYKSLGQYLTAHPMSGSDCCWVPNPRVAVSSDGQRLALVVVDKDKLTVQKESFTFSIYLFDIPTQKLTLLSQGSSPRWSPDGKRIAFVKMNPNGWNTDGGLWIAEVETGQVYPLVEGDKADPQMHIVRWLWSGNSQQIAYAYSRGIIEQSGIWVKNVDTSSHSQLIPNLPPNLFFVCTSWIYDNQYLFCMSEEKGKAEHPITLWALSIATGELKIIAQGFSVGLGRWSPDGKWLAFNGIRSYESGKQFYSLWLINEDGSNVIRITSEPPENSILGWSPDGISLILQREGVGLVTLSLESGEQKLILNLSDRDLSGYSIGGIK